MYLLTSDTKAGSFSSKNIKQFHEKKNNNKKLICSNGTLMFLNTKYL